MLLEGLLENKYVNWIGLNPSLELAAHPGFLTVFAGAENLSWYLTLSATSRMNSTPVSNSLKMNDAKFWTSGIGRTFMITSVTTPRVPEK
jgi:hypothetical protein